MNVSEIRTTGGSAFGANALNEKSRLVAKSSDRHAAPGAGQQSPAKSNQEALDPLVQALVDRLPRSSSVWSIEDRAKWLKAAAMVFNLIYKTDNSG